MTKQKLAIISTFDDLCGIAGYTRFLTKQLSEHFEVKVFDLDQYFMRGTHSAVVKRADQMIAEMAAEISNFDFVNIQLEYGTLGRKQQHIIARFKKLTNAARDLSVTFHTILPQSPFEYGLMFGDISKFRLMRAANRVASHLNVRALVASTYGHLRQLQIKKPVSIIVHTRRDMRLMKYVNGFNHVYDHPLSFVAPAEAEKLRSETSRSLFPQLKKLDGDAKIIGVFGFLGEYKGFETAVRSLYYLPENYHLAFFGGLHPNDVKKGQSIHPYVQTLLDTGNIGKTLFEKITSTKAANVNFQIADTSIFGMQPENLSARMHFIGPQTDDGFARGMAICDCVALPYLEVGQSSSGPISIAIDMGAPIVAARNQAFMQFARYHQDFGETFEVGNYIELAEKIAVVIEEPKALKFPKFNTVTNAAVYRAAHLERVSPLPE